ncbi:hypothetical protein SCALM49S_05843 [Streptomyces californicus]
MTTLPSSRKPRGSIGNTRCLPKQYAASRVTVGPWAVFSQRIAAGRTGRDLLHDQMGSAGTSGTGADRFHGGVRSGW